MSPTLTLRPWSPPGGIGIDEGLPAQAVAVGVWGRAELLAVLFVVFLSVRTSPHEQAPVIGTR